jgi:hypothetical protein
MLNERALMKKYVVTISVVVEAEDAEQAVEFVQDDLDEISWTGFESFSIESASLKD